MRDDTGPYLQGREFSHDATRVGAETRLDGPQVTHVPRWLGWAVPHFAH